MNENSWLYWRTSFFIPDTRLFPGFHEWKFMALLKENISRETRNLEKVSMNENSWLYWRNSSEIAEIETDRVSMNENSWLYWSHVKKIKRARMKIVSMNENSWLYWSSICDGVRRVPFLKFPWMKIHGSIEAWCPSWSQGTPIYVSMNENSWLYWSFGFFW